MKKVILLVSGLLYSSLVFAIDPVVTDTLINLQGVVISANKVQVNRSSVPLTISVIDRDQIEASSESALLPVLSERIPGLFVTEKGVTGFGVSSGSAGTVNIRGVGQSNKVLMLFDGQPQWAGVFGHSLPDTYVASDIERVEVIRGPGSLLYGSNAMGGVVNIITRQHPMQLDKAGIGRNHMKNDPVAFLLSCNHVVTVQSQMIMKAAMWNRAAVAMSNALPYAYLLNRRLIGAKPINDFDLNFILFIYFVPDTCMFNSDYWKWRMSKPTVAEIAKKHMETILSGLCIPLDILEIRENRIQKILQYRGYSDKQIDKLFHPNSIFDVPYDYPTSYFKCSKDDGSIVSLFSLNHKNDEYINTSVELPEKCVKCEFIPQNDLDGYITLETLTINGKSVLIDNSEKYYSKNQPVVSIILEGSTSFKFNAKFTIKPYIT